MDVRNVICVLFTFAGAAVFCPVAKGWEALKPCDWWPPKNIENPQMPTDFVIYTDEYFFSVSSASGSKGDIVGVSLWLQSNMVIGDILTVTLSHDPEIAEIVGDPVYSDEMLSLLGWFILFFAIDQDKNKIPYPDEGYGFYSFYSFNPILIKDRFPSPTPILLATIYYRLIGNPGNVSPLSFTHLGYLGRCEFNVISMSPCEGYPRSCLFISTVNVNGTLTILDGPTTNPDRPPDPPRAKIYPELPSSSQINYRVRLTGASALPGSQNVPIEVYATANVEYVGLQIPLNFDERYIQLNRIEPRFRGGATLINNLNQIPDESPNEGNAVIYTGLGINSRRLAAEGEELHVATLYFDVLDSAKDIDSTSIRVEKVKDDRGIPFKPAISILHKAGKDSGVSVTSEVEPIHIVNGMFLLNSNTFVIRGDANADTQLDISDPVVILYYLFIGDIVPECPYAADYDLNGEISLTDAIAILRTLFLGEAQAEGDLNEVPCR